MKARDGKNGITAGIEKLQRRRHEVLGLGRFRHNHPDVQKVAQKIESTLRDVFGESSPEYTRNKYYRISYGPLNTEDTIEDREVQFRSGILHTVAMLEGYIESLQEKLHDAKTEDAHMSDKPAIIFIGHGHSADWRELKDFVQDRLNLNYQEFNRESAAGLPTTERLGDMLDQADFALLVLTADDEHRDGSLHARENVIHELGLFQGRLGFRKAIVLLEEGCKEFSNIVGLTQIRFPKGHIRAAFEDIRKVLEREGMLDRTKVTDGGTY